MKVKVNESFTCAEISPKALTEAVVALGSDLLSNEQLRYLLGFEQLRPSCRWVESGTVE